MEIRACGGWPHFAAVALVFKLRRLTLAAGAQQTLTHQHSFRVVRVRRYYAGPHHLAVQVNGVVLAHADFTVLASLPV